MGEKLRIIALPPSGKSCWSGGAYCTAFVYSKYNGNFLVKGFNGDIQEYLERTMTHYFVNYALWNNGEHRDIWKFWKPEYYIIQPDTKRRRIGKKNYKWSLIRFSINSFERFEKRFRRFPKRWIPEFDNL